MIDVVLFGLAVLVVFGIVAIAIEVLLALEPPDPIFVIVPNTRSLWRVDIPHHKSTISLVKKEG